MTSPVYYFTEPQLAQASERARSTFGLFWRELSWESRRIVPAFELACVKVAFEEDGTLEHMWVGDVRFDGERLRGTLMNEPNDITALSAGDTISARFPERLGDWMLACEGKVYGAFTVNAMRAAMTAEERREHDEAWGLDFGDPHQELLPGAGEDHHMGLTMGPSLSQFLAEQPEETHRVDDEGFTFLHREALAGNACVVGQLLARGADVNARSRSGKTALGLARVLGWQKIDAMLVAAGGTE
jgi:uncharacterized protein YegJ (DUF2314 family)